MASALLQSRYRIVRILPDAGPIRYMIAAPSSGGAPVLINELSDRAFIDRFLGDLHEACYPKPAFSEYRDCFAENAKVYAVFSYAEGVGLLEYLRKAKPAFRYRLLLARDILTKFLAYYRAPNLIRCSLAQAENIVLTENTPYFNFRLLPLPQSWEADDTRIFRQLGVLVQQLFTPRQLRHNRRLGILLEKCRRGVCLSVGEMLRDLEEAGKTQLESQSFAAAIAARSGRLRRHFSRLSVVACLIAAVVLAKNFLENIPLEESPAQQATTQIGTLPIAAAPEEIAAQKPVVEVGSLPPAQHLAAPSAPTGPPPAQAETIYRVVRGDTLRDIAIARYGSEAYVDALSAYNGLRNKDLILTGASLRLPPKEALNALP